MSRNSRPSKKGLGMGWHGRVEGCQHREGSEKCPKGNGDKQTKRWTGPGSHGLFMMARSIGFVLQAKRVFGRMLYRAMATS